MSKYAGFLTTLGLALDANSKVTGEAVVCDKMVFSSSVLPVDQSTDVMPDIAATVFVNDARVSVEDPNVAQVEAILPPETGGFYIRSVGVLDTDGNLYAVANVGESYKPAIAEGMAEDLLQIVQFVSANTANISISIDPSVVRATRPWVEGVLMERDASIMSAQLMAANNAVNNDLQDRKDTQRDATLFKLIADIARLKINQIVIAKRASSALLN